MTTTDSFRLRQDVGVRVRYTDETPFGSGVSGLSDLFLRRSCSALEEVVKTEGMDALQQQAATWMPKIMGSSALGALYASPTELRDACVYPPPDMVQPSVLEVWVPTETRPQGYRLGLDPSLRTSLAPWLSEWQRGCSRPRNDGARGLWDALESVGAFARGAPPLQTIEDGTTLVGHASVAMQHEGTQLLFDPYLLPPCRDDPPGVRPHTPDDFDPDAIFITHSHPDHYDLSTLLRLPHDVPIYVPAVERECLLATDMDLRLRELGFTRIVPFEWHQRVTIGPFAVRALPFFGEQPTSSDMLHPKARNQGNTYLVDGPDGRTALIADAGRDAAGSTVEMAGHMRAAHGDVDVLFGGYRAWRLQPIRYLFSSVARYLLFVPEHLRTTQQQIMNDAEDLMATAEAWGARCVVPYANGGAPWFARLGLGPHAGTHDDESIDPDVSTVVSVFRDANPTHIALRLLEAGERLLQPSRRARA